MDIKNLYGRFLDCNGVSIDTRTIEPGALFFAIKGPNFDGNKYAKVALEKGAKYAIIDNPEYKLGNNQLILVEDTLKTLQALSTFHRLQFNIPIVGLTGSNGKTTTKELLNSILSTVYRSHSTKGNFNNHIGVPLTLLEMPADTEIAVIEMGANNIGEILMLSLICQPTHGLITNVGKAHLEGFGSFEGVKRAKSELYQYLANTSGIIFINTSEIELVGLLPEVEDIYSYSNNLTFKGNLNIISRYPFLKFEYQLDPNEILAIHTNLFGNYNVPNIATAISIAEYFKIDAYSIKKGIESYRPKNKRSELIDLGACQIIMDAYNANPVSMKYSIDDFSAWGEQDKTLILGDMLELGEYAAQEHKQIIDFIQTKHWKNIYVVGEEFKKAAKGAENVKAFTYTEELIRYLITNPLSSGKVLLKGSRIIKLERVLEQIKQSINS